MNLEQVLDFLRAMEKQQTYCKITLNFEAGKITLLKREETFKEL